MFERAGILGRGNNKSIINFRKMIVGKGRDLAVFLIWVQAWILTLILTWSLTWLSFGNWVVVERVRKIRQ